jgi:endonuclease/exonuclease/phosphatase (EEP) superfamily protein YafD
MVSGALDLATRGTARTILAGDFNTPRTSAAFDAWRGPLQHAWETAGTGFDATWPNPLPVLSIDQVWTDTGVEVLTCVHGGSFASDQRPVEFTFRLTR